MNSFPFWIAGTLIGASTIHLAIVLGLAHIAGGG
jgi:hypothetical protein